MLNLIMLICSIVVLINSKPYLNLLDRLIDPTSDLSFMMSCALCSGFWIGIVYHLITLGFTFEVIGMAAITSILSELLDKIIKK